MAAGEDQFIKRRIYLTLERGRNIALRNLFRKVFIAGGFDEPKDGQPVIRRTRVPVAEFAAALRLGTNSNDRFLDIDHAECMLANLIYKVSELALLNMGVVLIDVGLDEGVYCARSRYGRLE